MSVNEGERSDGFALAFANGRGVLRLEDTPLGSGIIADCLELFISDLSFPFDITGGIQSLKLRRHLLGYLKLTVSLTGLEEAIQWRLADASWCDMPTIGFEQSHIAVLLNYGPVEGRVPIGFRLLPQLRDGDLALIIDAPRVYGPLPTSSLVAAATSLGEMMGIRPEGLTLALPDPVKQVLMRLLPRRGWRLPDYSHAQLVTFSLLPDRIVIEYRHLDSVIGVNGNPLLFDGNDNVARLRLLEEMRIVQDGDRAQTDGQLEAARAIYAKALLRDPENPSITARLTMIDIVNAELRDIARTQAAELFAQHPDRADLAAVIAHGAALDGDEGAEAEACRILFENGDSLEQMAAGLRRGTLLAASDPQSAATALQGALTARRENATVLMALIRTQAALGHQERVQALIPRLIAAKKGATERAAAHLDVGRILLDALEMPEDAVKHFERAALADPQNLDAAWGLAESRAKIGDLERAIGQFERLERISKENGDVAGAARALAAIGDIWIDRKEFQSAVNRLREALALCPDRTEDRIRLARALCQMSRYAEAARELETALDQPADRLPNDAWATSALTLARLYLENLGDPDAAETWVRKCVLQPAVQEDEARALLLSVLESQGRFELLTAQLESEWLRHPSPDIAEKLAMTRRRQGDVTGALTVIEEARGQFPDNRELLTLIVDLSREAKLPERLRDALIELTDMEMSAEKQTELQWEIGRLELVDLDNPVASLPWLKNALQSSHIADRVQADIDTALGKIQETARHLRKEGKSAAARDLFAVIRIETMGADRFEVALEEAESALATRDWEGALKAGMMAADGPSAIKAQATRIVAHAFVELDAPDEAVRHLEQAAENLDPAAATSLLFLAARLSSENMNAAAKAVDLTKRVIDIDPEHGDARKFLATLLETKIHAGTLDTDDALSLMRMLRETNQMEALLALVESFRDGHPQQGDTFVEELEILTDLMESRDDHPAAYRVMETLIQYPDPDGVREARAARLAEAIDKTDEAREMWFRAIEKRSEPSRIIRLIALLNPSEHKAELDHLTAVAKNLDDVLLSRLPASPAEVEIQLWRAASAEQEGQGEAARAFYRNVVDADPSNRRAGDGLARLEKNTDLDGRLSAAFERLYREDS